MINYEHSDLFKQDGVYKQIAINFEDGKEIGNSQIYFEQFQLRESLCSETSLRFGCCEASELSFKISNDFSELKGKEIEVSMVLNGLTDSPFPIGKYKIYSDVPSGDRNYRNIVAYDKMYDILNMELTEWYEALVFPITLKDYRDSLFSFMGIEQETASLINDDLLIEKTISGTSLKGADILIPVCEINGVFGHIGRDGLFHYISLIGSDAHYLYPSSSLFPSSVSFPGIVLEDGDVYPEEIDRSEYLSCEYEDFRTASITGVQIRQEEHDLGAMAGTEGNVYVIQGNYLVYGKEEDELQEIALSVLTKIQSIRYIPFSLKMRGNPCMEVGDHLLINAKNKAVLSYVLERTITGIQSLKDNLSSKGVQNYEEYQGNLYEDVKQLKGKVNIFERTLDSTRSEIKDIEAGLSTSVKQNADSINALLTSQEQVNKEMQENMETEFDSIKKQLSATMTSEQVRIEIEKELGKGADKVTTSTGVTVDENGLSIDRSDSEMKTNISHDGMKIFRNEEEVLSATNTGVDAVNLHATTYLIIGSKSRFEDWGEYTACFWIGG